ncbi:molybdopterin biosynthesis protein MoeB (plasmid) [Variovorax sp. SRS16]|uniref:rhodanese-like domain-containing protein n=1 Tax=Variovorax sp. SRS16 TaxID=282217 RepID=UPI0013197D4F|nr:rhodanese-like domain-containing protein [Variovorax sp. SRS16]VTU46304.1 molybdopterin biosynthesis protein MoeB [Variovorax sp. SRS16]
MAFPRSITALELKALTIDHALLDIRDLGEYEKAHLGGATPLPRARIESDLAAIVPDTSACLVLYGEDDVRARLAAQTAKSLGYTDVRVLEGGIAAWQASGGAVHSGTNVPSKVFGESLLHEDGVPEVTVQELARELEDAGHAPLVIDVRTGAEFLRGCIPGAVNLPGGDLVRAASELKATGRPIVTHCAGRTRSLVAAATLRKLGIDNVRALRNGTMGWLLDGKQVETPAKLRRFEWRDVPSTDAATPSPFESAGVTAHELHERMAHLLRDFYLFDVRGTAEFEAAHVPGAKHVPGGQLVQCADDHIALHRADIIVVSLRAERAAVTASWLRRMGYSRAQVLQGGIAAWQAAGYGVEKGAAATLRVPDRAPYVDAATLAREIESDAQPVVLDLGSSIRFDKRHIPGAHWISRGWLEIEMPQRIAVRGTPIVVSGTSHEQAQLAARTLQGLGYTHIRVLHESIDEWREAKHPLEAGRTSAWSRVKDLANLAILNRDFEAMQHYLDWEVALAGKHRG